ncbi:hypothetical protein Droror1_Dr00008541, partial [Drosera rotundifolia]
MAASLLKEWTAFPRWWAVDVLFSPPAYGPLCCVALLPLKMGRLEGIVVGTITLLSLTGLLIFLLFFVVATINAIIISALLSLAAMGGFLALFFATLVAAYIGVLSVAVFVISATTISTVIVVLITTAATAATPAVPTVLVMPVVPITPATLSARVGRGKGGSAVGIHIQEHTTPPPSIGDAAPAPVCTPATLPGSVNRFTHAMMWKGGKKWALEFPDRSQWALFKEMHEE